MFFLLGDIRNAIETCNPTFYRSFHIRRKPLLVMGGQGFSTSAHGFRTEFQTLYQSKWKRLFK